MFQATIAEINKQLAELTTQSAAQDDEMQANKRTHSLLTYALREVLRLHEGGSEDSMSGGGGGGSGSSDSVSKTAAPDDDDSRMRGEGGSSAASPDGMEMEKD